VKLFSKNSNTCDHNPPTLWTDRQANGQLMALPRYATLHAVKCYNSRACTHGAQLSAGYAVNTHKTMARYVLVICCCRKPACWENQTSIRSIYSTDRQTRDRHDLLPTIQPASHSASTPLKAGNSMFFICKLKMELRYILN